MEKDKRSNMQEKELPGEKRTEHPRGWTPEMLKKMDVKVWSYLEEYKKEKKEIWGAIKTVLESGNLILGEHVKKFEEDFANFSECKYGVGVGNGTEALFIALKAIDIGAEDEVITVANTAVPTVAAIAATGARTKFVDIDPETYLMDVSKLEKVINDKTKAIVAVHLFGQCVDIDKIKEVIKGKDIKIIEDCAQAHGALYKGKKAGSLGEVAGFSFYPTKVLGAYGDGGLITTNNEEIYERTKALRVYGMKDKYMSLETGYNSRLDELHAAILLKKFAHLNEYIKKRKAIAEKYNEELADTNLVLPKIAEHNDPVYYIYVVRHPKRDEIIAKLKEKGIFVNISYEWPVHTMPAYKNLGYKEKDLPETEKACKEIFSLPMYPELTYEQQTKVIDTLKKILQEID